MCSSDLAHVCVCVPCVCVCSLCVCVCVPCVCVCSLQLYLAALGSSVGPAELAVQQVVGGHDGGGSVDGEGVDDVRQRVAQRLRQIRHHRGVQLLRA